MNVKIKFGLLLIIFSQASSKKIEVDNKGTSSNTESNKDETTEIISTTPTTNEISTTEVHNSDGDHLKALASEIIPEKKLAPQGTENNEPKESESKTEPSQDETTASSETEKSTTEENNTEKNSPKKPDAASFLSTLGKVMDTIEKSNFTQIYKKGSSILSKKRRRRDTDPCKPKGPSCSTEGTFRFKQNCKKYYVCYFDTKCKKLLPKTYTCPKCLKFNAQKNICDLAENVPECSNSNSEPKKYCTSPGRFFVPDNCQKYYNCTVNGSLIDLTIKTCPTDTVFSRKELKCVKGAKCNQSGPNCASDDSYSMDKFDCSKFYYCATKNFSVPLYCPSSYVFNNKVCEKWELIKLKWNNPKSQKGKNK